MPARTTLALLLVLAAPAAPSARASPQVAAREEGTPAEASPRGPAPSAEEREVLDYLRGLLAGEGRDAARALLEELVQGLGALQAEPGGPSIAYLRELDRTAQTLGSLPLSLPLRERIVATCARRLASDHPDLVAAQADLGAVRHALGDVEGAHALNESVYAARSRLLPADHPDLQGAMLNLAATRAELGDLGGARELLESVHATWSRQYPADHPNVLLAKQNLAVTRKRLGDLAGALELEEAVLATRSRSLSADHLDLLDAQHRLASTRRDLGDLAGARELQEAVHAALSRLLPPDHPRLLDAKASLGVTLKELHDYEGARELFEAAYAGAARTLAPDHPNLLKAKLNLAVARLGLGDVTAAHEMLEAAHEAWTRLLPADHPDLLLTKENLATTKLQLGDVAGAHELLEGVYAARSRLLAAGDRRLLISMQNLATTRKELGDLQGALELEEDVLEARARHLPPDHPALFQARQNLAATKWELGEVQAAHELMEALHASAARLFSADQDFLAVVRVSLATTTRRLGDRERSRELLSALLAGQRQRARALSAEAPRAAREGVRACLPRLFDALSLCPPGDPGPGLEADFFATLESLRLASVASGEAAHALAEQPELAALARGAAQTRRRMNDLVTAAGGGGSLQGWREEILELAEERDRVERELRSRLAASGAFVGEIDARIVAARLAPRSALASFLRYPKRLADPSIVARPPIVDSLLAFVVTPDGSVRRVELGPLHELEALVADWRGALGRPIAARGLSAPGPSDGADRLLSLGEELRARLLDPLLAVAGEVDALHVVLDDVVHLVPLDALPLGAGLVGERVRIRSEVGLARLVRGPRPLAPGGGLTAAGGIDYDAAQGDASPVRPETATPSVAADTTRSGAAVAFAPLPETSGETASIAALYRAAFEREAQVISGATATKAALRAAAPETRFLHLATHGWFASEGLRAPLDPPSDARSRTVLARAAETLAGFAPETLCGLALAGANRGEDALGRVPGLLTAEELASFDLRACELAVLSACETNVGIRRAGQGIQSLQTALHAAGARSVITSLWKVDDAASRRLFELFYTELWQEELGEHDALWRAKLALRAEGHPPRDWAGWVLSGEPQ